MMGVTGSGSCANIVAAFMCAVAQAGSRVNGGLRVTLDDFNNSAEESHR